AGLTYMDVSDGKFTIQNHILSIPTIIYPNGGEILIGSITIQWESSNDNQGHAINYSIFFFNGSAWEIVVEGLETNMYQWDTTYHSDGSDYAIAVITVCSEGYMAYDMSDDIFSILNSGTEPHTLSEPTILFPNGGETLTGIVTTYWTPSIDSLGHAVTYSIFYSTDGGTTWILLVSDKTSALYQWDTTSFNDGTNYLIMVNASCSAGLWQIDISDGAFTIANPEITTTPPTTTTTSTATITETISTIEVPPTEKSSAEPSDSNETRPTTTPVTSPGLTFSLILPAILVIILARRLKLYWK
ncbi:MAG: hypothetical protein ACFFDT_25660, partial [Candidatus Hodarchaeota archaeon]